MLHRLRHRLGYLILLLLFLPSLVLTSVGEARAHGAMVGVESSPRENVQKGHGHTHGHEHEDSRHLHNESGSHFHEKADRPGTGITVEPNFRDALRLGECSGLPLRRVYRLERPPRPVIAG
ncbi:hypothetical protein [Vreelandella sulfidaeris]|jgi:hypothetical protein|uniref:hypothetical protein n=1 Tax=Vreelandella sulfidaeris TaxID=115553 RepID=UPI0011BD6F7F|nr:hypothetical protein [Halomonas sulfidaeris]